MIDRNEFKFWLAYFLGQAKNLQTASNDYRIIPWADVALQLDMDPSNISKIVTGVTDCRVSTFFAILRCLGCFVKIVRYEDAEK